jgi:putative endopeptidase
MPLRLRAGLAALFIALPPLARAQTPSVGAAVDRSRMNTTCAPCRDFYRYALGAWLDRTPIKAEYTFAGVDREVRDRTEELLHHLLDESARSTSAGDHDAELVGTLYGSCTDSSRVEQAGVRPLASRLAAIAAIRDRRELVQRFADLLHDGVAAPIVLGAYPDFKNSKQTIGLAWQGGLGLPDRDFYLKRDTTSLRILREYRSHVTRMFRLMGDTAPDAEHHARDVMTVETALARGSLPVVEIREFHRLYHKLSAGALNRVTPHLGWPALLRRLDVGPGATFNLAIPKYYKTVDSLVVSTPVAVWQSYLRWQLVHGAAPWLSSAFVLEDLELRGLVTGVTELRPRWKRCADLVDQSVGEALGKVYVREAFPPEAKARALAMVGDIEAALEDRLGKVTWMSDSTRKAALAKLGAIRNKIGYPDRWRDYSGLTLSRDSLLENWFRANRFEVDRQLRKIDRPTDRSEWGMTPPTDNAYYDPTLNEMVFPAGILQPPYFDPAADDAVNYGGAGAVIGHELLHGFDDEGRRFDSQGNLREWWTPADSLHYTQRARKVVEQYSSYIVSDTTHMSGQQTLDENLADIGGLQVAWEAYQRTVARKGKPQPADGFTPAQRFFLSYANSWRIKMRPEAERTQAISDVHSLSRFRVNGSVGHLPAFAEAFGCKPGDPIVRPDSLRLDIW